MKDAEWGGLAAGTGATDQVPTGRRWDRGRTAAGYSTLEASEELLEVFNDEEDDPPTISSRQASRDGDVQGIPWDRLQFDRPRYRATRLAQYPNYLNLEDEVKEAAEKLNREAVKLQKNGDFYRFSSNARKVRSSIVHFQLRNLVWANSKHDVYFVHNDCLKHWSAVTQQTTKVIDATGLCRDGDKSLHIGRVHISTCCVRDDICVLGGFSGELVVRSLGRTGHEAVQSKRLTYSENGITNGLEVYEARSGASHVMTSNNDAAVRVLDTSSLQCIGKWELPWAVNWSTVQPGSGRLAACVGDDPQALLLDASTGQQVAALDGHIDFSFAAAWHPAGNLLATGNQDKTMRVWDVRKLGESLALVKGNMAAIRSIRFTSDGKFCAAAEAGDFVHIMDVASCFTRSQEIDLFGEVAGMAFSPDASKLFLGISDVTYSSLLQYKQRKPTAEALQ